MKRVSLLVLLGAATLFGFGLYRLFQLRYETGDVYPEYSSLRADPLGTMALYEALGRMPGVSAERDYSAENQLPRARQTAYLHLAASRLEWTSMDPDLLREIEGFVSAGGRLVISFTPDSGSLPLPSTPAPPPPAGKKAPKKAAKDQERELRRISPPKALGFQFGRIPLPGVTFGSTKVRVTRAPDLPLPEELVWHSAMAFTNLDAAWQVIYAHRGAPVLIERKFGLGTIVLSGDSYFLSNEALLKDRQPELLAWILGPARRVLFDEAHLGIVEGSGMAILMRKYRLHGFGAALLLLAALFIWQNATSFPPPLPVRDEQEPLTGKQASSGFTNLLRRNLRRGDLLRTCFDEWTKSLGIGKTCSIDRVDAAQAIVEAEAKRARTSQDPVRAYNEISAALKKSRA